MNSKLSIIATENVILVVYQGKRIQFRKDVKPNDFMEVKELFRQGKEDELIKKVFGKGLIVPVYSKGLFSVDEDKNIIVETSTQTPVAKYLSKRIIQWAKDGLPFESLLNFHKNTINNPNKESIEDLYEFLEKNMIALTSDGTFIAYKKVKKNPNGSGYVDCYTGKIANNIGTEVSMERKDVNSNRNQTCSSGLHVCGWDYLSQFSGDAILEVEINPFDVVSVPTDYKATKMRVCKYKILGLGGEIIEEHFVDTKEKYSKEKIEKKNVENWEGMTAQNIKDYIFDIYNIEITLANKNKKAVINKADKIIAENF